MPDDERPGFDSGSQRTGALNRPAWMCGCADGRITPGEVSDEARGRSSWLDSTSATSASRSRQPAAGQSEALSRSVHALAAVQSDSSQV